MENMTDLGLPYCKEFQANHISYMERRGEKSSEKERREEGREGKERRGWGGKRRGEKKKTMFWSGFPNQRARGAHLAPADT